MATSKPTSKDKGPALVYAALTRIDHDGEVYENGEAIELAESAAKPLLAVGAIQQWQAPAELAKK